MQSPKSKYFKNAVAILATIIVFLFAIELMGEAFDHLGKEVAQSILFATSNPFVGLFIGLLMTAIIQSSSTSTSMIVAVVATGAISIADAVPMIMGANIGTTLTSTIVSLGFMNKKYEFRRAISAGVIHDFFNILTVLILFPLEYYYGLVSNLSQQIAKLFLSQGTSGAPSEDAFKLFDVIPLADMIVEVIDNGFFLILISFVLLFGSIKFLTRLISKMIIGESQDRLRKYLFNNSLKSFFWGTTLTAAVQSSSITTSLMVPFVATNKVRIDRAMPFILGANIGTTITAFIAVLFKSDAAMSIAITHLLINLIGVLIFLPFPFLRKIPIKLSQAFGTLTMNYRLAGLTYIIFVFFILPFILIYFGKNQSEVLNLSYRVSGQNVESFDKDVINKVTKFEPLVNQVNDNESINQVHRRNNILFFNKSFFMINKKGFCWDNESKEGKYQICIEDVRPSYSLANGQVLDSIFYYKKTFYNPSIHDSVYYTYLVSIDQKVLISKKKIDKNDKIIYQENLKEISKP